MPARRIVLSINTSWNILNFRASLVRALIASGYEVVAIAPPDAWSTRLAELGCRYIPLAMDNKGISPRRDLALLLAFRRLLAAERPAAFLGYTIKPNVYGSLAAHSLSIPTINNISGLGTAFIRRSWLTAIVQILYRLALGPAGRVFFQNEEDRALFVARRLVHGEATEVLPGSGIDLVHFSPAAPPVSSSAPVFLLIARLLRDKGVVEFVEAARLVRRDHPTARFQLLGFLDALNRTAITREEVESWVAEGTIEYLGVADDVRPFIAAADCVVLPSYREGTPRTLLEAAAMARPLIATDVPGCRDVVDEGVNGLLCAARDAADLAKKLEKFIALPTASRHAMGAASRLLVEKRYDEHIVISRYLETLAALVPADAPPPQICVPADAPTPGAKGDAT